VPKGRKPRIPSPGRDLLLSAGRRRRPESQQAHRHTEAAFYVVGGDIEFRLTREMTEPLRMRVQQIRTRGRFAARSARR